MDYGTIHLRIDEILEKKEIRKLLKKSLILQLAIKR